MVRSHDSCRAITDHANVVAVPNTLIFPHASRLLFSWPRANFKTRFMKVVFVSEMQKETPIAQWLRNCQLNIESSWRGCIRNWHWYFSFETLLHKQCYTCSVSPWKNQWTQSGYNRRKRALTLGHFISCIDDDGIRCDGLQKGLKFLHFDVAKWGVGGG